MYAICFLLTPANSFPLLNLSSESPNLSTISPFELSNFPHGVCQDNTLALSVDSLVYLKYLFLCSVPYWNHMMHYLSVLLSFFPHMLYFRLPMKMLFSLPLLSLVSFAEHYLLIVCLMFIIWSMYYTWGINSSKDPTADWSSSICSSTSNEFSSLFVSCTVASALFCVRSLWFISVCCNSL